MTNTFLALLESSSSRISFDDGSSMTSAELAANGARLAAGLQNSGLKSGDRIAIWLANGAAYLEVIAACAAGSFVGVNVNTRYSPTEAATLIERSGAALTITDQPSDLPGGLAIMTPTQLPAIAANEPIEHRASAEDPFLVFTTSGTTSKPKMVLHKQRSIVQHSLAVAPFFGLSRDTPALVALPMCGVFGLNSFASAIAGDSPIWLAGQFDAAAAAEAVVRHHIVAMNGSDDMFYRMMQQQHDLSSLKICGYGAFNASLDDVAVRADTLGMKLSGVYGMSEVQALLAFRGTDTPLEVRRKSGGKLASPHSRVRVVDPDSGDVLPHETEGELQLQGPSLFAGYLAEGGSSIDAELTGRALVDEWFSTGDLGTTNADGSFTFITRMGDVLRLGGFLVAPAEIEEVLLEHDAVNDVQVVAAAGPNGARPVAFVISEEVIDEAAVIAHCHSVLAKFKCPVRIITVAAFPATDGPNGVKIQKTKLREMARIALAET